jgi:uncharacterized protein YidB (DUF937 family)
MAGLEDILGDVLGGGGQASAGGGLGGMTGGQGGAGGLSAGNVAAIAAVVGPLLVKFLRGGGMEKMLGQAQGAGVRDKAQSWVSKGENKQIGAVELEKVVGSKEIDEIANAVGADRETTANMLAQALPQVVDQATPDGKVPDQAELDARLRDVLESKAA